MHRWRALLHLALVALVAALVASHAAACCPPIRLADHAWPCSDIAPFGAHCECGGPVVDALGGVFMLANRADGTLVVTASRDDGDTFVEEPVQGIVGACQSA